MSQVVKCLPCSREDLSLILNTHIKQQQIWHGRIVLWLGRWSQEDPWSLLERQVS